VLINARKVGKITLSILLLPVQLISLASRPPEGTRQVADRLTQPDQQGGSHIVLREHRETQAGSEGGQAEAQGCFQRRPDLQKLN
jgi:hypothetical protein